MVMTGYGISPARMQSIRLLLTLVLLLVACLQPEFALAADDHGAEGGAALGVCNTDAKFQCPGGEGCVNEGLIEPILKNIRETVNGAWQEMNKNILSKFIEVATACMMLYIIIAGVMFTLGMVQLTISELATRVVKLVIIAAFLGAFAMTGGVAGCDGSYFDCIIRVSFRDGTDSIIEAMTQAMVDELGGAGVITNISSIDGSSGTFKALDDLILRMISPSTIMIWMGMLQTFISQKSPAAGLIVLVMGISMLYLMIAIARAVWVYIVALLATTLLFGLGPIFICFALFERTKSLFQGWLSQLVNFSLQPILMFTFMTFFAVLMQSMLGDIIKDVQVCMGNIEEPIKGLPTTLRGLMLAEDGVPWEGKYEGGIPKCKLAGSDELTDCSEIEFPIGPIEAMAFMLVAYIAFSFYDHVISIANEISGAFIDLELGSPVRNITDSVGNTMGQIAGGMLSGDPSKALKDNGLGFMADAFGSKTAPPPSAPRSSPGAPPPTRPGKPS